MYIRKFLQRRDAVSIVVAIILAMIGLTLLSSWAVEPTESIVEILGGSEAADFGTKTWQDTYLAPLVQALVALVLLEVILRIFVPLRAALVRQK